MYVGSLYIHTWPSLETQMVKNLSAMQNWVQFLGWEDPLEKGMETHSSILAWRISRTEEPGVPQTMESQSYKWLSDFYVYAHIWLLLCQTLIVSLFE